jgi:hypothetical protein
MTQPRRWFQIHLSTAIVMMLVVALLMLSNFQHEVVYWTGFNSENFRVTFEEVKHYQSGHNADVNIRPDFDWSSRPMGRERYYGWPLLMVERVEFVYFSADGWRLAPTEEQVVPWRWYYHDSDNWYEDYRVYLNIGTWLSILAGTAILSEVFLRGRKVGSRSNE